MSIFEKQSTTGMLEIVSKIKSEFRAQGHRNTGKFEQSVELEVNHVIGGLEFVLKYLHYGAYLEKGVTGDQIKYPFAKERIKALTAWAKRKGMNKPRSAAYGIAMSHKKNGMPTDGSKKFSSNGRRKFFQSYTLAQNRALMEEMFGAAALKEMETITDNVVKEYS